MYDLMLFSKEISLGCFVLMFWFLVLVLFCFLFFVFLTWSEYDGNARQDREQWKKCGFRRLFYTFFIGPNGLKIQGITPFAKFLATCFLG